MEIKRWASQAQHQPTFARATLAFHRYVDAGIYVADWCGDALLEVVGGARRTCDYASLIAPTSSRGEGTGCDSVSA